MLPGRQSNQILRFTDLAVNFQLQTFPANIIKLITAHLQVRFIASVICVMALKINMFYALACKIVACPNKGIVFGAFHIKFPELYFIDLSLPEDILKSFDLNNFSI